MQRDLHDRPSKLLEKLDLCAFGFGFGVGFAGGQRRPAATPAYITIPNYATITAFGDSFTDAGSLATPSGTTGGTGNTASVNSWSPLLAAALGATLTNKGVAGTVMQASNDATGTPRTDNGVSRFQSASTAKNGGVIGAQKTAAIFVALGYNDARYIGAPSTFNAAGYARDYRSFINGCLIAGYSKDAIYIISPWYVTDAGLINAASSDPNFKGQTRSVFEGYVAVAAQLAAEYGLPYHDAYAYGNSPAYLADVDGQDHVHPANVGHGLIKTGILTRMTQPNTRLQPATVTASVSSQTITLTAASVAGAVSYEYVLMINPVDYQSNTSGAFPSLPNGSYYGRARAVFSGGGKGPWTFTTSAAVVSASTTTTLGQTESYASTADGTPLLSTSPAQGAWTLNSYSTSTAAIGTNAIRNALGTTAGFAVYHLTSSTLGNGVYVKGTIIERGGYSSGAFSVGLVTRSDPSGQNYLAAVYNGLIIRIIKVIGGVATQIGASYSATFTTGASHVLEFDTSAGSQTVYLDGVVIINGTEPEANLTALGTGLGIRMAESGTVSQSNSNGPAFSSVTGGKFN